MRSWQMGTDAFPSATSAFGASAGSSFQSQPRPPGVRHSLTLRQGNPQPCRLPASSQSRMRPERSTRWRQALGILKGQVGDPLPPPTEGCFVSVSFWDAEAMDAIVLAAHISQQIPTVESHPHHSSCSLPD